MYSQDFDQFRKVMDTLAELFGKAKLSDEALGAYWEALKDLHIAVVEREAKSHGRYGKFFPKPVELRPKTDKAPEPQDEKAIAESIDENIRNWESMRVENPLKFWRTFRSAYIARLYFRFKPSSPEFRDAANRCLARCNEEFIKLGATTVLESEIDSGVLYEDPTRTKSAVKPSNAVTGDSWVV